jgi:PilZ domain
VLATPLNTRRWARYHVDLPVRISVLNGLLTSTVPGRVVEISRNGMAVHSALALKPGDLMQVEFPISKSSGVRGVVRNRKDDCFGVEFLPQLNPGDRPLNQSTLVRNPLRSSAPKSPTLERRSCTREALLASLHRKQLEMKQLKKEIEALNLAIPLLADDEKRSSGTSLPRRPKLQIRPWPSQF